MPMDAGVVESAQADRPVRQPPAVLRCHRAPPCRRRRVIWLRRACFSACSDDVGCGRKEQRVLAAVTGSLQSTNGYNSCLLPFNRLVLLSECGTDAHVLSK